MHIAGYTSLLIACAVPWNALLVIHVLTFVLAHIALDLGLLGAYTCAIYNIYACVRMVRAMKCCQPLYSHAPWRIAPRRAGKVKNVVHLRRPAPSWWIT